MSIKPFNRRLLIEPIVEEKKSEGNFIIPEDMRRPEAYSVVKIVAVSENCILGLRKGQKAIVLTHLIEEVKVNSTAHQIVGEDAVVLTF